MINICFASDDRYAPYMGIAIHSILTHANPEDHFHFFVLEDQISEQRKAEIASLVSIKPFEITYISVDMKVFEQVPLEGKFLSKTTYVRVLLGSLLGAEIKRIIYLDCDVLVVGSLKPFFDTDLKGRTIGGVVDLGVMRQASCGEHHWTHQTHTYINAGVLLLDLERWRQIGAEQKLLDYMYHPAWPLQCNDQDVINFALKDEILAVGPQWNTQLFWFLPSWKKNRQAAQFREKTKESVVIHYCCSNKPWHRRSGLHWYGALYREYMKGTPWRDAFMQAEPFSRTLAAALRYIWRHPVCWLKPSFYQRIYLEGISAFR